MSAPPLSRRQHPLVQRCRQLASGRGVPGEVLLDGEHLVRDAVSAAVPLVAVLIDHRQRALAEWLTVRGVEVTPVTEGVIAAASPVRHPTGVVAIGQWAATTADALVADPRAQLVGLVDLQDPGNVGTIIRSAAAFGASGVLTLGASANPAGWRALRSAMGSTFRIPVATGSTADTLVAARRGGLRVVAATPSGGDSPSTSVLAPPVLVLVGGEGAGLPDDIVATAEARVTLPMRRGIDSLNAGTTASILLWEMARGASTSVRPS